MHHHRDATSYITGAPVVLHKTKTALLGGCTQVPHPQCGDDSRHTVPERPGAAFPGSAPDRDRIGYSLDYREAKVKGGDKSWIAQSVGHINQTILLAALTTIIGFSSEVVEVTVARREDREFPPKSRLV